MGFTCVHFFKGLTCNARFFEGINADGVTGAGAACYSRAIIPKLFSYVADAAELHVGLANRMDSSSTGGAGLAGGLSKTAQSTGTVPCIACSSQRKR